MFEKGRDVMKLKREKNYFIEISKHSFAWRTGSGGGSFDET